MAPVKVSLSTPTCRGPRAVRASAARVFKTTYQPSMKAKKLWHQFIAYPWIGAEDSLMDDVTSDSDGDNDRFDDSFDELDGFTDTDGDDDHMVGVVLHIEPEPVTESGAEGIDQRHVEHEPEAKTGVEEPQVMNLPAATGPTLPNPSKMGWAWWLNLAHVQAKEVKCEAANHPQGTSQQPEHLSDGGINQNMHNHTEREKRQTTKKPRGTSQKSGHLSDSTNHNIHQHPEKQGRKTTNALRGTAQRPRRQSDGGSHHNIHQNSSVHTHNQNNEEAGTSTTAATLDATIAEAVQTIDHSMIALRDSAPQRGGTAQEQQAAMERFYLPASVLPVVGGTFAENRKRLARTYRMLVELELEQIETAATPEELMLSLALMRRQRVARGRE